MSQTAALPTWVPVYVERAIFDLIPDSPHARESARVAWMWDDLHPGYENELYKWQNEAIRQRRDLIALTERMRELGDRIEAEEGSYWPPRDNTPEPPTLEVSKLAQRWINELREYVLLLKRMWEAALTSTLFRDDGVSLVTAVGVEETCGFCGCSARVCRLVHCA